ncbi:SpoIIE family protein phosphatase [Streptomyces sp. TRM S81-3]|uniref:protein-serine/threonine phosphatase n=1 Tax=Streptomyces griseicoloratus TaxID=2752516 RepID=A0A926LD15_9ACTN|nr:SpoIIE family protein phosphatase [Streptomyces griseicoloratus]MBD0424551.1 SpoIIE family protein phosphatase [Streptomyces griseicoloratus]
MEADAPPEAERLGFGRTWESPGGLLDLLSVSAVVLDASGRIVFWSPQASETFGYTAEEALGRYAAPLLLSEEHRELAMTLFAGVMSTGEGWAGVFPIRHKDGDTRLVEFRNMRLLDDLGDVYALGIAVDQNTLHGVENKLALSEQLVSQAPVGIALLDTDLRYRLVNPALERINGVPAADHIGRRPRDIIPFPGVETVEFALRQVLTTGTPLIDQYLVSRTLADPDHDHAWSVSYYRIDGPGGRVIGAATSVVDVSERHRVAAEADRARRRLAVIADASARVGTTLDVERTAQELSQVAVPDLADVAAVDVLDAVMACRRSTGAPDRPEVFRALAIASAYPTDITAAADAVGEVATYGPDRLITQCVHTARPVVVPRIDQQALLRIARDPQSAAVFARAGVHSYLAVPLLAHNEVLGAFDLLRARNPDPFGEDDVVLARELAARAAVAIDNARWHQSVRNSAETLQRSLLPSRPPDLTGLTVASFYQPAQASSAVGGDWYDVIPLDGDKTALVVGDVMGNGIDAAATMGRLRTATRAYADLDLAPHEVLQHLDKITHGLEHYIATCLYAIYDPHRHQCRIANAGHLPPALIRHGRRPELLDLPTGAPLGVGGVRFRTVSFDLSPDDRLLLYTDGLVETRDQPIDERIDTLLDALDDQSPSLDAVCRQLLDAMGHPDDHDDVALLLAKAGPLASRPAPGGSPTGMTAGT